MGGGGLMIWGMITSDGECSIKKMDGKINADDYIKTIKGPQCADPLRQKNFRIF